MELPSDILGEIVGAARASGTPGPMERRRAARVWLSIPTGFTVAGEPAGDEPAVGIIRDISAKGLSFVCSRSVKDGDELRVKLPRAESGDLWGAYRVVRWSTLGPELFIVGAEFMHLLEPGREP